ncbi:hypothetical protein BpHYR1_036506 [Brachionus plicatilis]|uniref:Uncharacterized protein n=1 Tax=Brachionus plicatilis TaxID=10195 RepID=A0A3M7RNZ6_BRAPC|nr:hypothetical protein BpHYR1_036506 [Brachionus plicatilis]
MNCQKKQKFLLYSVNLGITAEIFKKKSQTGKQKQDNFLKYLGRLEWNLVLLFSQMSIFKLKYFYFGVHKFVFFYELPILLSVRCNFALVALVPFISPPLVPFTHREIYLYFSSMQN